MPRSFSPADLLSLMSALARQKLLLANSLKSWDTKKGTWHLKRNCKSGKCLASPLKVFPYLIKFRAAKYVLVYSFCPLDSISSFCQTTGYNAGLFTFMAQTQKQASGFHFQCHSSPYKTLWFNKGSAAWRYKVTQPNFCNRLNSFFMDSTRFINKPWDGINLPETRETERGQL